MSENIPTEELRDRVLFTILVPAARLAARFRIPLRDVKRTMELAYYREIRNRGLTMREMVDLMSVSMRKVSQLSNELKAAYSRPYAEHGIERRIVSLLLAGEMTKARIVQALDGVPEADVRSALESLKADHRVAESSDRTPRYALTAPDQRLVREPWQARIDALDHLMRTVGSVVEQRFFDDAAPSSFARTLSFRASTQVLAKLKKVYDEQVFPATADPDPEQDGERVPMNLAILWGVDPNKE